MRRLLPKNLKKGTVPNRCGLYIIYNRNKTPVYVGHSRKLRHRIQSYAELDNYQAHPTKKALRREAKYFRYRTMPLNTARKMERRMKIKMRHNHK